MVGFEKAKVNIGNWNYYKKQRANIIGSYNSTLRMFNIKSQKKKKKKMLTNAIMSKIGKAKEKGKQNSHLCCLSIINNFFFSSQYRTLNN